jgi:hypothetical protein
VTTEVVVMNTSAVAMAADSAVSIPFKTGTKTYTRARKLHPLHKTEPVAVMVWDAPGYLAIPWEVITAEFRNEKRAVLPELDDYIKSFFEFVDTKVYKWISKKHESTLLAEVLNPEIQLLQDAWRARLDAADRPSKDPEIKSAAAQVSRAFAANMRGRFPSADPWRSRDGNELEDLDTKLRPLFERGATGLWRSLDPVVKADLVELGRERMSYIFADEPGSSGLVFAGYGSSQLFAQASVWRVSGRLDSETRRVERRSFSISPDHPSLILPVGQEGVIHSFLKGLHPEVDLLVSEVIGYLAGQFGFADLAEEVKKQFDEQVSMRGDEVARAVEFLPPRDLAMVAGDLIRMTALRNRATITADTVGGPIDVVLLSRADGLRWIELADGFRHERNQE